MKPQDGLADRRRRESWFWAENDLFSLGLTPHEGYLYLYLCRRADGEGSSFPSVGLMARETRTSTRKVQDTLMALVAVGLLHVDRQPGRVSLYTVLSPRSVLEARRQTPAPGAEAPAPPAPTPAPPAPPPPHQVRTKDYPEEGRPVKDDPSKDSPAGPAPSSSTALAVVTATEPVVTVQRVLTAYHDGYLARVGSKPPIVGGRDGKLAKDAIAALGGRTVLALLDDYLASEDTWIREELGFSFPGFISQLTKLNTARTLAASGRLRSVTTRKTQHNLDVLRDFRPPA